MRVHKYGFWVILKSSGLDHQIQIQPCSILYLHWETKMWMFCNLQFKSGWNLKVVDMKLEATAWNDTTQSPKLKGKSQSFAWQYMLVLYEIDLMMQYFLEILNKRINKFTQRKCASPYIFNPLWGQFSISSPKIVLASPLNDLSLINMSEYNQNDKYMNCTKSTCAKMWNQIT